MRVCWFCKMVGMLDGIGVVWYVFVRCGFKDCCVMCYVGIGLFVGVFGVRYCYCCVCIKVELWGIMYEWKICVVCGWVKGWVMMEGGMMG